VRVARALYPPASAIPVSSPLATGRTGS